MRKKTVQDQQVVSRHQLGAEPMSNPEIYVTTRQPVDKQQLNHAKSYVCRLDATGLAP